MDNIGEDEELNIIKQKSDELVLTTFRNFMTFFLGKNLQEYGAYKKRKRSL